MISEKTVFETVLSVIQAHVSIAINIEEALKSLDNLDWEKRELEKNQLKIEFQEEVIGKNRRLKTEVYEDFKNQLLTREEYHSFQVEFDRRIQESSDIIKCLVAEQRRIRDGLSTQQNWISEFKELQNIHEISRNVVVSFIDRILVYDNKSLDIQLRHRSLFSTMTGLLNNQNHSPPTLTPMEQEAI